jgi:hypothetical protein
MGESTLLTVELYCFRRVRLCCQRRNSPEERRRSNRPCGVPVSNPLPVIYLPRINLLTQVLTGVVRLPSRPSMSKNEPSSTADNATSPFYCRLTLTMYWLILSSGLQLVRLVEFLLNAARWCTHFGRAVDRWLQR